MANNQQSDQQPEQQPGEQPGKQSGTEQRSEGLLPAQGSYDDGRFEVAEEVSLDQQSDKLRQVGQGPGEGAAEDRDDEGVTDKPVDATLPDPAQQSDG